ncbi:baseplate hub subunit [Pectobacterium phage POP12]|nr:baseplate hub subunit [Pectobacterium phage POP12]
MRKHKLKHLDVLDLDYRILTIADEIKKTVYTSKPVMKHQKDYVYVHALMDSKGIDEVPLKVKCDCGNDIKFNLQRNQIMIEEMDKNVFGNDIKIQIRPRNDNEEIFELIDYVFIDGDRIAWIDCKQSEKEAVLNSIDYEVFKSISIELNKPRIVANIPIVCSCGKDKIITLSGIQEFLEVLE